MRSLPVRRAVLVVLLVIGAARAASAQALAVDPPPPPRWRHPHAGFGGGVAFGQERQRGFDHGWVGRAEFDLFPALTPRGKVGPFVGTTMGLQIWDGPDGWGVGLPFAVAVGVRAPGVRAGVLFGLEMFSVESMADDTGVGLYQPLAGARLALDLAGWYAGVDVRVTRRWQFGADDHTQWQGVAMLGFTWESKLREPVR